MATTEIRVVAANAELLAEVARTAREADRQELWASHRSTPEEALAYGLTHSETFVALADGVPICAFGITPYCVLTGHGIPWMVGTVHLDKHARAFIVNCRRGLKEFFGEWTFLTNAVDTRNEKAVRWLKWLGFYMLPPVPVGPDAIPFHPFFMEPRHV